MWHNCELYALNENVDIITCSDGLVMLLEWMSNRPVKRILNAKQEGRIVTEGIQ
jgi:hypothetical protein